MNFWVWRLSQEKKISLKSGMHDKQKVNVIFIGLERLDPWNQIVLSGVISISITPLVNWSCTYIISSVDVWRGQSALRLIVGCLFFFSFLFRWSPQEDTLHVCWEKCNFMPNFVSIICCGHASTCLEKNPEMPWLSNSAFGAWRCNATEVWLRSELSLFSS